MPPEIPRERPQPPAPERLRTVEPIQREETLKERMIMHSQPHGAELVMPGPERDTMKKDLADLRTEYAALLARRDAIRSPEDERAFVVALASYEVRLLAFGMRRDQLVRATAEKIVTALDLPPTEFAEVAHVLEFSFGKEPSGADSALRSAHASATASRRDVLLAFTAIVGGGPMTPETLRKIIDAWNAYREGKASFDALAEQASASGLAEMLGVPSTVRDVRRFIDEVTAPLPPLDGASSGLRSDRNMIALAARLEAERVEMAELLPALLRNPDPHEREKWSWHITKYLLGRGAYVAAVTGKVSEHDQWAQIGTMVTTELLEEGAEELQILKIGNRSTFLRGLEGPVRLRVLQGLRSLRTTQNLSGKMLGQVLDAFGRSPLGPKFWNEMFRVESAATILLWGYYVHTSPNKLRASVQFGSFIALSNAVSKVSGPVAEALMAMNIGAKIPAGNFAIQFAIALTVAYVASDEIAAFAEWVDETIPDSSAKHQATVALGILSGGPVFSGLDDVSEATGLTGVLDKAGLTGFDPDRDLMAYLGTEAIRGGEWGSGRELELDYRYVRDTKDWNDRLKMAIAAQDNDIQKRLWETLSIDGSWPQRQALQLYSTVASLRGLEESLSAALRTAGVLRQGETLNATTIATAEKDIVPSAGIGAGDDLRNRNDRFMARAFDWDDILVKAGKHFNALSEKDPNRIAWKEYVRGCNDVAKQVSIYRHVRVYARDAWLGDLSKLGKPGTDAMLSMPDMVRQGMIAEIRHQMDRRTLLSPEVYPHLTKPEFREKLVGAVKLKDKLGFLEEGMLLLTNPDAYHAVQRSSRDAYFALIFAVQEAQDILPDEVMERALQPIREMVLAGKVASLHEIRAAIAALNNAVIEHSLRDVPLKAAPENIRVELGVREGSPVLLQGDAGDAVHKFTTKKLEVNFFFNAKTVDVPGEFHPLRELHSNKYGFDSLHVVRIERGGWARTYQHHTFDCHSSDRTKWRVRVLQGNLWDTHFKREDGVDYRVDMSWRRDPEREMSFADWQKQNMEIAFRLEPDLKQVQAAERAKEEEREREKAKEDFLKELAIAENMLYIHAGSGGLRSPDMLQSVPRSYANDPTFGSAFERQERIRELWTILSGHPKAMEVFKQWGDANMKLRFQRLPTFGQRGPFEERQPQLPPQAVSGIARSVWNGESMKEYVGFLNVSLTYIRLCAEQAEFLKKNPLPRPQGPEPR